MRAVLICLSLWSVTAMAQPPATPSCVIPEYRQFDFWVGEWDVTITGTEKQAGTNSIRRILSGCVLHESWASASGFRGESFNIWDASRKVWHQTWVDHQGGLLIVEGGLKDGRMVLEGEQLQPSGKPARQRITYTPNRDGTVRQHWEASGDGKTWTTVFDGTYTRRQGGADTEGLGRAQRSMLL
jgi:hypothetical protein